MSEPKMTKNQRLAIATKEFYEAKEAHDKAVTRFLIAHHNLRVIEAER